VAGTSEGWHLRGRGDSSISGTRALSEGASGGCGSWRSSPLVVEPGRVPQGFVEDRIPQNPETEALEGGTATASHDCPGFLLTRCSRNPCQSAILEEWQSGGPKKGRWPNPAHLRLVAGLNTDMRPKSGGRHRWGAGTSRGPPRVGAVRPTCSYTRKNHFPKLKGEADEDKDQRKGWRRPLRRLGRLVK